MWKLVKQKHWGALYHASKWETKNPNWQPRKGISYVNEELKKKWYHPASKQDIEANYMSMLQLERSELVRLSTDITKPVLVNIIAKAILSKRWFDIIEKMLDRWIWKAVQPTDNKHSWNFTLADGLIKIIKSPQKKEK